MDTCQIKVCGVNQVLTDDWNLSINIHSLFPTVSMLSWNLSLRASPQCGNCLNVSVKSWIAESDFSFRDARVPQGNPSTRLQAYSREKPKRQCCNSAIETEDYHHVNTFFTSLDKILAEIENPFRGNDWDVFCFVSFFFAFGDIYS